MGVYDFDLQTCIELARRLGTDTERVEVKAAAQGLPKSMAETLSAFSNTSGGVVVLGLAERAGFQAVPGFKARAVADALAQMCGEKMEPPVRASVEIVEFEGSPVVVATVPELPPELKPCFVKSRAMHDGSYARVGDGDRRLSPYEVDRLLEGRRPPHYDREVVEGAAMGDFDEELLEGFMRRQRADSPRAFKGMSDEELLEALCVTARDGEGIVRPTLAGLMALGRFPQRYFPRACLSFTVIPGTSKADVSAEGLRFLDSREIVGPIPVMISELMDKKLKPIETRFDQMQEQMDLRFNLMQGQMDTRFAEMQGTMDTRLAEMQGTMDLRFDQMQNQLDHMNLLMENDVLPRLQNIESCYVDTYRRYVVKMEEMDSLKLDMDVVKDVLKEHSGKLEAM